MARKTSMQYIEAEKRNSSLGMYVDRVVIPTEKVMTQRAGKKVLIERPLLSGRVSLRPTWLVR